MRSRPFHWFCACLGIFLASTQRLSAQTLIELGETWKFTNAPPELVATREWRNNDFLDTGWRSAPSGFGNTTYGEPTRFDDFTGDWSTVLFRKSFLVGNPEEIRELLFRVDYSDGFILYLNGEEVARRSFPAVNVVPEVPPQIVPSYRNYQSAEVILLPLHPGLLRAGTNVLAVRVQDVNPLIGRPVFVPELLANFVRTPYLQLVTAQSASVLWRLATPSSGRVEIGIGGNFEHVFSSPLSTTNHEVAVTNLQPDTVYHYRVILTRADVTTSTVTNTFRTLPTSGNLTVALLGDSGWGSPGQFAIARQIEQSGANLVLHLGDIVYPGFYTNLADLRFLSVYRQTLQSTPFYSVWGNHDFLYTTEWNGPYQDVIRQPRSGVSEVDLASERAWPGAYYSFDAGDVHFCMLFLPLANIHTLGTNTPQYRWLEADLAATAKPWRVICEHLPLFSSSLHRHDTYGHSVLGLSDSQIVAANLLPLARKYGVQLICSGHEHVYERMLPFDGIYNVVSGGGGAGWYPLLEYDALSSQFINAYHYLRLFFEGDTLRVTAVGANGAHIDGFSIHRTAPAPIIHDATWQTPVIENTPGPLDGNHPGQSFDLFSAGVVEAKTGRFSNLGRLHVALDKTNLYLGLEFLMLPADSDAYLFIGCPGKTGVSTLAGLGNGIADPAGQGVDAIDFLENLSFTNFTPAWVAVLGDEYADDTYRGFARTTNGPALGQGVFRLERALRSVPGIRLQQFNRTPQDNWMAPEHNADFIELAIPRTELGDLTSGDTIQIGVVVGGGQIDTFYQTRNLDTGFVGEDFTLDPGGAGILTAVRFRLPADPDPDGDGLDAAQEAAAGTNPADPDTDRDGLPDGWEVQYHLNPISALGPDGADGDPDEDGVVNRDELAGGTDPNNFASPPPSLVARRAALNTVTLSWHTRAGRAYLVEAAGVPSGPFHYLEGFPRTASGSEDEISLKPAADVQFYRARVQP